MLALAVASCTACLGASSTLHMYQHLVRLLQQLHGYFFVSDCSGLQAPISGSSSRAVGLMKQLDAGGGYREQIQKEVQSRLAGAQGAQGTQGAQGAQGAHAVCAACHTLNDSDAKFCKNCGAKL